MPTILFLLFSVNVELEFNLRDQPKVDITLWGPNGDLWLIWKVLHDNDHAIEVSASLGF